MWEGIIQQIYILFVSNAGIGGQFITAVEPAEVSGQHPPHKSTFRSQYGPSKSKKK